MFAATLGAAACGASAQAPETGTSQSPSTVETTSTQVEASGSLPDLTMDFFWNITYTSDCPWDGPGYLIVRGRNIGTRDASEFQIKVWNDYQLVDVLPSGEQIEARFDFEAGPVGSILAVIDPDDQVLEIDEENNEFQIIFTPPPRCTPTGG